MVQHVEITWLFAVKVCPHRPRALARVPNLGLPRDQWDVTKNRVLAQTYLFEWEAEGIDIPSCLWVLGHAFPKGILHLPVCLGLENRCLSAVSVVIGSHAIE